MENEILENKKNNNIQWPILNFKKGKNWTNLTLQHIYIYIYIYIYGGGLVFRPRF